MDFEQREKWTQEGESYCDRASILAERNDFQAAIELYDQARQLFERIHEPRWLAFLLHEKFHLLHRMKAYEEALQLSEPIILNYRETENSKGLFLFLTHKAALYLDQGNIRGSLECLRIAEVIDREEKLVESRGYLFSNIAANLYNLGNYAEAIGYLGRALDLYRERPQTAERMWCHLHLGKSHHKIYRFRDAEMHYSKAYHGYLSLQDNQAALSAMTPLRALYAARGAKEKLDALDSAMQRIKRSV